MTAQISVMNKNAVALATDSAVTTRNGRGSKVHNSANKLFTLSKFEPVGVMIYASAEFMGYPWETLIKVYRKELGTRTMPTVTDYARDFFEFLAKQRVLFSDSRQEAWFRDQAKAFAFNLNNSLLERFRKSYDEHGEKLDEAGAMLLFSEFLSEWETQLDSRQFLSCYDPAEDLRSFQESASPVVNDVLLEVFQELPIEELRERIRQVIIRQFLTDSVPTFTGIVFAGFGESEFLPVVESFWIDGMFANILRYVRYPELSGNMNEVPAALIIPFAQSDSVLRFLKGVDPTYKTELGGAIDEMLGQICAHVGDHQPTAPPRDDGKTLDGVVAASREQLLEKLAAVESIRFLSPVMDVVGALPKEDLAAIAESLVNLTSFQRKILQEVESVGGPIDVAVISKGDGFVWIKRKHYFDKELNPAFFANYYRGESNEDN